MNKIGQVIIVIALVSACYLIILVTMGVVVGLAETANATMTASSNLTNYPGAAEAVLAAPWVLWFVPGVIGMVAIVVIMKRP